MTYSLDTFTPLLMKLARRHHTRLRAAGSTVEFEDLLQEARVTFLVARDLFDPDRGVKFMTYLYRAVDLNLRRLRDRNLQRCYAEDSLDRETVEDGGTLHEVIAAPGEAIDERLYRQQLAEHRFGALSLQARSIVLAILNEEPELLEEVERMRAFRRICKERGFAAPETKLSVRFCCEVLDLTPKATRAIVCEINHATEMVL